MEETMSEATVEELVEQAKAPGTFSILNALKERAYPVENIDIYLDEDIAFLAAQIEDEINSIGMVMDRSADDADALTELLTKREELIAKREDMVKQMGGAKYIFTITGISEGLREDIYNECVEKYPIVVNKKMNPLTAQEETEEVENPERNRMFTNLLWQAYITKITAPDGSVQNGITFEDAVELRRSLPIASSGRITESIEKLRAATAVFMVTVDEDFLAKS
jgi:hypothetical protein